jgi:hypothetical protein
MNSKYLQLCFNSVMFPVAILTVHHTLHFMRMSSRPTAERQRQRCRTLTQNIHPDLLHTQPVGQGPKSEKEKQTPGWGRLNET